GTFGSRGSEPACTARVDTPPSRPSSLPAPVSLTPTTVPQPHQYQRAATRRARESSANSHACRLVAPTLVRPRVLREQALGVLRIAALDRDHEVRLVRVRDHERPIALVEPDLDAVHEVAPLRFRR